MATTQQIRDACKRVCAEFQAMAPAITKVVGGAVPVPLTPSEVPIIEIAVEREPSLGSMLAGKKKGEVYGLLNRGGYPLLKALMERMEAEVLPGARQGAMDDLRALKTARRLKTKLTLALAP